MSDNSKRLICKNFFCNQCYESFKKLQNINIDNAICPKCNSINCKEKKNEGYFSKNIQRTNFDFNQILNGQNIII